MPLKSRLAAALRRILPRTRLRVGKLEYLVVGTGCCGTVYVAKLLSRAGIPCSHEAIFTPDGMAAARERLQGRRGIFNSEISTRSGEWLAAADELRAEASYLAAPFLCDESISNCRIIHLVRNPLRVISSFVLDLEYFRSPQSESPWNRFIYQHLPEIRSYETPAEQAAMYYVGWNRMIERACRQAGRSFLFHRIEDGDDALLRFVGSAADGILFPARDENTKRSKDHDGRQLELADGRARQALSALAGEYGYAL